MDWLTRGIDALLKENNSKILEELKADEDYTHGNDKSLSDKDYQQLLLELNNSFSHYI